MDDRGHQDGPAVGRGSRRPLKQGTTGAGSIRDSPFVGPVTRPHGVPGVGRRRPSGLLIILFAFALVGVGVMVFLGVIRPPNSIAGPDGYRGHLTYSELPELGSLLQSIEHIRAWWVLHKLASEPQGDQMTDVAAALAARSIDTSLVGYQEAEFIAAFAPRIANVVSNLTRIGGYRAHMASMDLPPVRFFRHDNQVGVLLPGIALNVDFNTRTTDEYSRMQRVVFEMAVAELRWFASELESSGLTLAGFALHYGTRDFGSSLRLSSGETVVVVAPLQQVGQFASSAITDRQLIARSVVFGGGRSDFRRLDLTR